jgi:hypothetical protein
LLRAHLDRRGFTDVEIVPLNGEHPAASPVDARSYRLEAAVRDVYGHLPVLIRSAPAAAMYPHHGTRHPHRHGRHHLSRLAPSRPR